MDNPKTSFQGLKWRVGVSTVVAAAVWSRRPGMAAAGVQKSPAMAGAYLQNLLR